MDSRQIHLKRERKIENSQIWYLKDRAGIWLFGKTKKNYIPQKHDEKIVSFVEKSVKGYRRYWEVLILACTEGVQQENKPTWTFLEG